MKMPWKGNTQRLINQNNIIHTIYSYVYHLNQNIWRRNAPFHVQNRDKLSHIRYQNISPAFQNHGAFWARNLEVVFNSVAAPSN